ncbi:hypothetical protein CV016_00380 [Yersinia kristensenii]|nr:hypothetical protein CU276_12435 [Yersinia kristensenii]PJG64522.1 hypothetical protein CV016_00380 [Yersinia kristensenii]
MQRPGRKPPRSNDSHRALNRANSNLAEVKPMDGPNSERGQHTCDLKDDGYSKTGYTRIL